MNVLLHRCILGCVGLFVLVANLAVAQVDTLVLSDAHDEQVVGGSMQWWFDPSLQATIYDLMNDDNVRWVNSPVEVPNLGYRDDAVWFRFRLINNSSERNWNFVVDYPLIRELDVFYVADGSVDRIVPLGERFEFSARPVWHRNFIIPFELSYAESLDVYVRVTGPYAVQMPAKIMNGTALLEHEVKSVLVHGLFFGFVVVMGFYNLFLFISTRENTYLFYVLFIFSIGLFQFVGQGFAYQFLWPREVWWQNKSTGIFIHLSLIFGFLFVNSFLELKKHLPLLFRQYFIVAIVSLITLCSTPFLDEFWVMRIGVFLALPATLIAILGGWKMWGRGRSEARIFSIAWITFLFGVLLLALNKLGLIPRNFVTEHGAEIGTVVELALLAFALAGRIKIERQKRQQLEFRARDLERAALLAKEQALEMEKMNSEQLERNVRERTRDLHKALSDLSVMNRRLEQMNLTDSVTGVGNENSFLAALTKEWDRSFRVGEVLSLIVVELDGYRDIVADHGAVASDECLRNVASILEHMISRPADVITRYGDKVFGVILPGTSEKGATHLASNIVDAVSEHPFDFGIAKINASVSVGVATVKPRKPDHFKELLMSAESAVYVAQNSGGNRVQSATMSS